ncbi:MAG TPA: hypothetical protein VJ823_01690 [Rhodanobacteraceae bacterium]|nr:hypothetical protein [Rhodanobacteraceae bacterium]
MIRAIVEGLYWVATIGGAAAGLYAAWLWHQSATSPEPYRDGAVESGEPIIANAQLTAEILRAAIGSAALNRQAALWTARAVLLGVAAVVLDHLH